MFRFEHPEFLRVLWALPVLLLLLVAWRSWRRKRTPATGLHLTAPSKARE